MTVAARIDKNMCFYFMDFWIRDSPFIIYRRSPYESLHTTKAYSLDVFKHYIAKTCVA